MVRRLRGGEMGLYGAQDSLELIAFSSSSAVMLLSLLRYQREKDRLKNAKKTNTITVQKKDELKCPSGSLHHSPCICMNAKRLANRSPGELHMRL